MDNEPVDGRRLSSLTISSCGYTIRLSHNPIVGWVFSESRSLRAHAYGTGPIRSCWKRPGLPCLERRAINNAFYPGLAAPFINQTRKFSQPLLHRRGQACFNRMEVFIHGY